jgi:hypothetical protein
VQLGARLIVTEKKREGTHKKVKSESYTFKNANMLESESATVKRLGLIEFLSLFSDYIFNRSRVVSEVPIKDRKSSENLLITYS